MPIKKKGGKYYWGSKGPFDSRAQAEEVAGAAYSSGYDEQKMVSSPVGATDEGQRAPTANEIARNQERLRKEDGGAATVFTSGDAGIFTPTHGGQGVHAQQEKKKKHTGIERVGRFIDEGSPHVFSKELSDLDTFVNKSWQASDNYEAKNRGEHNTKRLNWKKKPDAHVEYNNLPEGQFYKQEGEPPAYVEPNKNKSQDKEKWVEYTIAHQKDMENRIKGYDKNSKRKHGDADEPPAGELGGSAGQIDYSGLQKQVGYGLAGQDDDLSRGGDKDKIPEDRNDETEEDYDELVGLSKGILDFIQMHKNYRAEYLTLDEYDDDDLS